MHDIETRSAVDQLRRHDTPALRAAFARIPRVALLAILDIAGVCDRPLPDMTAEAVAHFNGMRALALEILARAGFDVPSILAAAITGQLEGDHHDGHDERAILDGREPANPDDEY